VLRKDRAAENARSGWGYFGCGTMRMYGFGFGKLWWSATCRSCEPRPRLVAATAAEHDVELATCDRRATPTYERYGVRFDFV
jgi:hypothetical protein